MARRKTAKRSGNRQPEAIAMLIRDHQKVQKLFQQFQKTDDVHKKAGLAEEACNDLTVHTRLEEQVFYPAIRQTLEETDLLDEAEVEHNVAKDLIEKLKGMHADDDAYSATFIVLSEYVSHHIEEEQNELFPKVKKSDIDFDTLAGEMQQKKQELREELGLGPEPAAGSRRGQSQRSHAARASNR